jgi:hypothetical protein
MTAEDLRRCERELVPLVPLEGASAFAREDAREYNADVADVRDAVLEPFRGLLAKGRASPDLADCVERTVAELAFWRRVLVKVHEREYAPPAPASDFLLRYVLS